MLRLLDLQNDHESLRVGLVREEGIVTSAYVTIRKRAPFNSEYLAYLLHTYDLLKVFYSFGGGIRQAMKFDDLKRLPVLAPPLEEQNLVVTYLNRQIETIDQITGLRRIDKVRGVVDDQIILLQEIGRAHV